MKIVPVVLLGLGLGSQVAYASCIGAVVMGQCHGTSIQSGAAPSNQATGSPQSLFPNLFGPGVHGGMGGRPVTLHPDNGATQGEQLQVKPNAYGPGVHMDQYGRPVRERSWP